MEIEDKLYQDFIAARKAKDKPRSDFLGFIRSQLKNKAIESKVDKLDDIAALQVLQKQQKRGKDALAQVEQSNRPGLKESLQIELDTLAAYLPQALNPKELDTLVDQAIAICKAQSLKDMGAVMKEALAQAGAQADAKTVSALVREKLA